MIVQPKVGKNQLNKFVKNLEDEGVKHIYADPKLITNKKSKMKTVFTTSNADYVVLGKDGKKVKGKKNGKQFKILSNKDIDGVYETAKKGLDFVIIEVKDWKIIPLENIIAKLHKIHTKIFTIAKNQKEVRKMFSILDVGVDGVIFQTGSIGEVQETLVNLGTKSFDLKTAKITEIQEVGDGERVCVDTASMLHKGEGMLIGSRANFMFLVHNESVGSSFTSPRPFRVNAGAVHCYTLSPDGNTKYLSELETGSEVLILNSKGKARRAAIGRCKIEKRPMLLIKAKVGNEVGGIIAQDAETIRFVKANGQLVSVTHLKKGDSVLAFSKEARRNKIRRRIRAAISGTPEQPRLAIFRSNKEIYAQIINDGSGSTIVAASSRDKELSKTKGSRTEISAMVGKSIGEKAIKAGISEVSFDRSGYLYHGRVKSLAEGAREAGLKF